MNPGRSDQCGEPTHLVVRDSDRLAALIVLSGLTSRALATRIGWASHSYVVRLRTGQVRTVTVDAARRIAEALDVPLADLFVSEVTTNHGPVDHGMVMSG